MPFLGLSPDIALPEWPRQGLIAIMDLEFTSWEGSLARNWSEPWEWREIVQIGALMVDATDFSPRLEFEALVKPQRNPVLSDYFQNLTGIRQTDVDANGKSFPEALSALVAFLAAAQIVMFNGYDGQILQENCAFHSIKFPLDPKRMFDFRPLLANTLSLPHNALTSSGLPKIAGIAVNGRAHNGLYDCHAIASSLGHWRASDVL
jgi:inhibitor of KinA sporulation pathway (predicted exonuclease)